MQARVEDYVAFQRGAVSTYHVQAEILAQLRARGCVVRCWSEDFAASSDPLVAITHPLGKGMVVVRRGCGDLGRSGARMVASHLDSPHLRLRLNPWLLDSGGQLQGLTQVHGSLIGRSWLDRPLHLSGKLFFAEPPGPGSVPESVAGMVAVHSVLVASPQPVAVIPDLAIHLDPQKNQGSKLEFESALRLMLGRPGSSESVWSQLLRFWGVVTAAEPIGFELQLAPAHGCERVGLGNSYLVSPRHDDLAMVFASLEGFLDASPKDWTQVLLLCDSEETGSLTHAGAESFFYLDVLSRLCTPGEAGGVGPAMARSILISADMAHGYHPAYPHLYDPEHRVDLGCGLVLKEHAGDRYATSASPAALVRRMCREYGLPLQHYIHRQDLACGSTVGPILAARLGCATVDLGVAMWGMHSAAETVAWQDLETASRFFYHFFSH